MKTRVIFAACAILALASIAHAQNQPPSLRKSPGKSVSEPSPPLALEIFYNSTLAPAYLLVEGSEVKPHWIWVTKFTRLAGWQLPAGASPIRAVRIMSQWNGETAEVRVTLLRGIRSFDQEDLVDRYSAGVDETRFIKKLEDHGIEPFKITLRLPSPVAPPPPGIENHTQSIEIVGIEAESSPLAAYRVKFRNLSEKHVAALKVESFRDGAPALSTFFQAEEGQPRIESNTVREEYIPAHVPKNDGASFSPSSSAANSIAVISVVFTDGTFEGDVSGACLYESYVAGYKAWLKTALKVIDEQLLQSGNDEQAKLQFKEKISALSYEFTAAEKAVTSVVSAKCPNPALPANSTIKGLNLKLLAELEPIITTRPRPLVNFREWLELKRKSYQQWLKSLENFRGSMATASQSR